MVYLAGCCGNYHFKWLVKVGASIYQTPDLKKILAGGGGGSGQPKKTLDTPLLTLSNLDQWPRGPVDLRSYWPEGQ